MPLPLVCSARPHLLSSLPGHLPPKQIWHQHKGGIVNRKGSDTFLFLSIAVRQSDASMSQERPKAWEKNKKEEERKKNKGTEDKGTWQAEWGSKIERVWVY